MGFLEFGTKIDFIEHLFRDKNSRIVYDNWLREQRLRENAHRVDQTIILKDQELELIEELCRCGATFEISVEELERILDFALFECENCSLCLKVSFLTKKTINCLISGH